MSWQRALMLQPICWHWQLTSLFFIKVSSPEVEPAFKREKIVGFQKVLRVKYLLIQQHLNGIYCTSQKNISNERLYVRVSFWQAHRFVFGTICVCVSSILNSSTDKVKHWDFLKLFSSQSFLDIRYCRWKGESFLYVYSQVDLYWTRHSKACFTAPITGVHLDAKLFLSIQNLHKSTVENHFKFSLSWTLRWSSIPYRPMDHFPPVERS